MLGRRISCITAQTIVRHLVSKVQGIHLIRALSDMAQHAFHGMGAANGAMHDRWKGRKRQKMLFIFTQAADRFWIALTVFGCEGGQIEKSVCFLLLLPDTSQFGCDLLLLTVGNG